MNGKKVAIYYVGFIILICLIIVAIMQFFFATYEPKENPATTTNFIQLYEPLLLK